MTGLKQHKQLCYTIKQQLSREVALEKVKTAEKFKTKNENTTGSNNNNKSTLKFNPFNQKTTASVSSIPSTPSSPTIKAAMSIAELMSHREIKPNAKKQMFKDSNMLQNFIKRSAQQKSASSSLVNSSNGTNKSAAEEPNTSTLNTKKYNDGIWLKYKEGFINAIRYNIKINQLL
jgi:hypothetical protein